MVRMIRLGLDEEEEELYKYKSTRLHKIIKYDGERISTLAFAIMPMPIHHPSSFLFFFPPFGWGIRKETTLFVFFIAY